LSGVVCLTVAPHLRWWPSVELLSSLEKIYGSGYFGEQARIEWGQFVALWLYLIIFAAAAGYFVFFWPGRRPVLRILWSVCLPALVGMSVICGRFLKLSSEPHSVLERSDNFSHFMGGALAMLWKLGPGLHFCVLGLLLILIVTSRLAFGIASLPLALASRQNTGAVDAQSWRSIQMVIWILVSPVAVFAMTIPVTR
jgi:hypothetical protein